MQGGHMRRGLRKWHAEAEATMEASARLLGACEALVGACRKRALGRWAAWARSVSQLPQLVDISPAETQCRRVTRSDTLEPHATAAADAPTPRDRRSGRFKPHATAAADAQTR
eukprot:131876-Prymnesium_polylepis.1